VSHSLHNAWWLYWICKEDSERERDPGRPGGLRPRRINPFLKVLTKVYREHWVARLDDLLLERNMDERTFRRRMLWDEHSLRRWKRGVFDASGGLPPLYLRTMAIALGVPMEELEPSQRELFVKATCELCQENPSSTGFRREDAEAYVEYFFQTPTRHMGRLDTKAAERAFEILPDRFSSLQELAEGIKRTAKILDDYLVNHEFFRRVL